MPFTIISLALLGAAGTPRRRIERTPYVWRGFVEGVARSSSKACGFEPEASCKLEQRRLLARFEHLVRTLH